MRTHIQILAWIYLILGGVTALRGVVGVFLTLAIGAGAIAAGVGPSASDPLITIAAIFAYATYLYICIGIPTILAGWGLLKRRQWGRILGIVVSVLCLPLKFALLFGIYGLIVLLWPGAAREFS